MKASVLGIVTATVVTLPVQVLLIFAVGMAGLALLVYVGVVLPAVWSADPARRRAAAALLRQILSTFTRSADR